MAEKTIRGINCPACGGSLEIREGTVWLRCSYCGAGLLIKGDRGIGRFYVPMKRSREELIAKAKQWMGKFDKAVDLRSTAKFTETFPVYVPFWRVTGTVVGWVLGDVKKGSGKDTHYDPVERQVWKDFEYTCPACDIGEFGVKWIDLTGDQILPFDLQTVQKCGMTFEVLTTSSDVINLCVERFPQWGRESSGVDRVTFCKLHTIRQNCTVVFYPLWVLRYEYKNRIYQLTSDAESGELLYGRAPGNNAYRVACLLGAIMLANLIFTGYLRSNSTDNVLGAVVVWIAIIAFGFWKFRYGGEVIKKQKSKDGKNGTLLDFKKLSEVKSRFMTELQQQR